MEAFLPTINEVAEISMFVYIRVSSLKNAIIEGPFKGCPMTDGITGKKGVGSSDIITISAPTDMLYSEVTGPITITDIAMVL